MPLRQKLRKVFSSSRISKKLSRGKIAILCHDEDSVLHIKKVKPYKPKYDKNGNVIPEIYKPGEVPRPKYREPRDKNHIDALARFSFRLVENPSIVSEISPLDTEKNNLSSPSLTLESPLVAIHRSSSVPDLSPRHIYQADERRSCPGLSNESMSPGSLTSPESNTFGNSVFSRTSDDGTLGSENPFGSFQWTQASSVDESGCDFSQPYQQRASHSSSPSHASMKTQTNPESTNLECAMGHLSLQA